MEAHVHTTHFHEAPLIPLAALALGAPPAMAVDSADWQRIRDEIDALRRRYDARIADFEARLEQAEAQAAEARGATAQAEQKATEVAQAAAPTPAAAPAASNAFNPDIALILSGTYANFSRNPDDYRLTGFISGSDIGPANTASAWANPSWTSPAISTPGTTAT